jgi:hypothetical protein
VNGLVDAARVAELLGVKVGWVLEHTRAGNVPHVMLGRYPRYDVEEIAAWIDSCKRPGRPIAFRRQNPRRI